MIGMHKRHITYDVPLIYSLSAKERSFEPRYGDGDPAPDGAKEKPKVARKFVQRIID